MLLLKDKIEEFISIDEEDILEDLNQLYIDSRYPGELGLLPSGKPSMKKAKVFYEFAQNLFNKVCEILEIDKVEISKRNP